MNTYVASPKNPANSLRQYNISPNYATSQMYSSIQQVQPVQTVSMHAMPYNTIQVPIEKEVLREVPVEKIVVKEVSLSRAFALFGMACPAFSPRQRELLKSFKKFQSKKSFRKRFPRWSGGSGRLTRLQVPVEKFFEKVYEKHIEVPVEKIVNIEVPVERIVYKERESPPAERERVGRLLAVADRLLKAEWSGSEYYTYVEEIVPGFAADLSRQIQVRAHLAASIPSCLIGSSSGRRHRAVRERHLGGGDAAGRHQAGKTRRTEAEA
eukprot:760444-Hanusia_phi.AAC.10